MPSFSDPCADGPPLQPHNVETGYSHMFRASPAGDIPGAMIEIRRLVQTELAHSLKAGILKQLMQDMKADLLAELPELTAKHVVSYCNQQPASNSSEQRKNCLSSIQLVECDATLHSRASADSVSRFRVHDPVDMLNECGGHATTELTPKSAATEPAKVVVVSESPASYWNGIGSDTDARSEFDGEDVPTRKHTRLLSDEKLLVKIFREQAVTERYEVQESVWDLAIFIGAKEIGLGGSVFSFILLCLTLLMQFMFCAIINDTFTIQKVSKYLVRDLEKWRTFAGHDLKYIDPVTRRSLTSRVCSLDGSLSLSTGVVEILTLIRTYMPRQEDRDLMNLHGDTPAIGYILPQTQSIGQILCLLALMVWYLTLSKDAAQLNLLCWATQTMKTESATRIEVEEEKTILAAVTGTRKIFLGLLVLARMVQLCVMLVCGTLFLAYTISMQDIFLNAVALEIVFGLDELIYQALAPSTVCMLIKYMEAWPTEFHRTQFKGLNFRSPAFLIIIMTLTCLTIPILLAPQAEDLKAAYDAVCKGDQGFVAAVNKFGLVTAARDASHGSRKVESTYVYKAFRELIETSTAIGRDFGRASENKSLSVLTIGLEGADFSLRGYESMTLAETTKDWNSACLDVDTNPYGPVLQEVLADGVGSGQQSLTCSDAIYYRNHDSLAGVRSRQICAESCGCNNLTSSLVLFGKAQGCPSTCMTNLIANWSATNLPCVDADTSSPMFENYLHGLQELRASYSTSWGLCVEDIYRRLQQNGCHAVANGSFVPNGCTMETNLCDLKNVWNLKSLRYMCPMACKCRTLDTSTFCPSSCMR